MGLSTDDKKWVSLLKNGDEFRKEWKKTKENSDLAAGNAYAFYTKLKDNDKYNDDNDRSFLQKASYGLLGSASKILAASEQTELTSDLVSTTTAITSLIDDSTKKIKGWKEIGETILDLAFNGATTYLQQQSGLIEEINKKAGLTGKLSEDLRNEITEDNPELLKYGVTFDKLANAASSILINSGRFLTFNKESFAEFAKVGEAYTGNLQNLVDMFPAFEKVGYGARTATEEIGQAGQRALSLGLNSQKVTKDLSDNIGLLNSYGFQNGIKGLDRMIEKSIEFKTNLATIQSIADKVMDPQGALDLAAKLQVVGGAIGVFNDPIKLLHMSTNDLPGLQDAFIKAAGSLATLNNEGTKFTINPLNLRRARDIAAALSMDYKELTNTAIKFQERQMAMRNLSGLGFSPETQEFIANVSRMEKGKIEIDISGTKFEQKFGEKLGENSI